MMQTTDLRNGNDSAARRPLDRTRIWAVLLEREMGSCSVIVVNVRRKHPAQVALVEDDQVVQAFPPDRADDSFDVCILPRRA